MIELTAIPPAAPPRGLVSPGIPPDGDGFALLLGAASAPAAALPATAVRAAPAFLADARQSFADDGSSLPTEDDATAPDTSDDNGAATAAWLAAAVPAPPVALPAPPAGATTGAAVVNSPSDTRYAAALVLPAALPPLVAPDDRHPDIPAAAPPIAADAPLQAAAPITSPASPPPSLPLVQPEASGADQRLPSLAARLSADGRAQAIALPDRAPVGRPVGPPPAATIAQAALSAQAAPTAPQIMQPAPPADAPAGADASDAPVPPSITAAPTEATPATPPLASPPATSAPAAIQPARQAFAAALSGLASASVRAKPVRADDRPDTAPAPTSATVAGATAAAAVAPAAESHRAPLDLRQDRGLQAMIDRIEVLRDDVDARDTRIRLVPDALGTIDIAVRTDGDAVHVRFATETEAARAALADAQPRLADLAEARDVRIAGTSIETGLGGDARRRSPAAPPAPLPAAPPRRTADPITDQRLA